MKVEVLLACIVLSMLIVFSGCDNEASIESGADSGRQESGDIAKGQRSGPRKVSWAAVAEKIEPNQTLKYWLRIR